MIPKLGDPNSPMASPMPALKMSPTSAGRSRSPHLKISPKQGSMKKCLKQISFDVSIASEPLTLDQSKISAAPASLIPIDETAVATATAPNAKKKKNVSFNKRVRIRKIRQLEDMPSNEIADSYFSDKELVNIRNGLRVKIRSLVEQNFHEHHYDESIDCTDEQDDLFDASNVSNFCIRGLEHEFPQGKFRRKQLKMMSRGAVLEEQKMQREFFVHSERSSSTHSTDTASTISSYASSASSIISMKQEDPSIAIAEIYRIESKPAVQLALEYGKRDEYVADQIYFAHTAV